MVAGLSVGILVLALLVTTSGPRVRHVAVQKGDSDAAAGVGQGLTVVFDRPVEETDFEGAIEIEPEAEYTVNHRKGQLSITFDENLLSNTEYLLTVRPELEDDLGRRMEGEYGYEFTSAEPSFTYLERNYGRGEVDRIVQRAPLSGEDRVLFGEDRIKSFDRNDDHLAVVLPRPDGTDEVRVVDLATREERLVDVPPSTRVDDLSFSPTDNRLAFVTRGIYRADADESDQETYANKLYIYDVDDEQLQPVDTLSDRGNVERVLYSGDGQALLYKSLDGAYYLTGAARATEPTVVGIYGESGGFDRTNTKLVFQSGNGATIYDARAKESQELPEIGVGGLISAPAFLHNSDGLIYRREVADFRKGEKLSSVEIADAEGEVEEQVLVSQPQTDYFDDPVVSHDDRYVLVEAASESSEVDDYAGNKHPEDARLILYDRSEREVIEPDTRGIDPVWNR